MTKGKNLVLFDDKTALATEYFMTQMTIYVQKKEKRKKDIFTVYTYSPQLIPSVCTSLMNTIWYMVAEEETFFLKHSVALY